MNAILSLEGNSCYLPGKEFLKKLDSHLLAKSLDSRLQKSPNLTLQFFIDYKDVSINYPKNYIQFVQVKDHGHFETNIAVERNGINLFKLTFPL